MNIEVIRCVFCGQDKQERIIKFTPESLNKCLTILEYRRCKPVLRKSRAMYEKVELSPESSLYEGYHPQCYKLFTAIKIPSDFPKIEKQEYAVEWNYDQKNSGETSEWYVPVTNTIQAAGTWVDEAGVSSNVDQDIKNFYIQGRTDDSVSKENLEAEKCVICEKPRKRRRGREVSLSVNTFNSIDVLKSAATEFNDLEMLEKISSYTDESNITYHKCCKEQYLRDILNEVDTRQLIEEVKSRPVLWDESEGHFMTKLKLSYWLEITKRVRLDFIELSEKQRQNAVEGVIRKWKRIRDAYFSYKNNVKFPKMEGSQTTYIYSKEMEFLDRVMHLYDPLRKREEPEKITDKPFKRSRASTGDEDVLFFKSIMPKVKKIPDEQKQNFQTELLQLLSKYQPDSDGSETIPKCEPPSSPVDTPQIKEELENEFETTENFILKKEHFPSDEENESEF